MRIAAVSIEGNRLGVRGERIASATLVARGWRIVGRNVRLRSGEIDLIALDGRALVFVEVKTRSQAAVATDPLLGRPVLAVGTRKQARLRRLAAEWIQRNPGTGAWDEVRFDAIGVLIGAADRAEIEHLEAAF